MGLIAGLPDLNQSVPYVQEQLLSWVNSTLTKFPFDGLRIDTVKHVNDNFWRKNSAAAGVFSMGEVMNGDPESLPDMSVARTPCCRFGVELPAVRTSLWKFSRSSKTCDCEHSTEHPSLRRDQDVL